MICHVHDDEQGEERRDGHVNASGSPTQRKKEKHESQRSMQVSMWRICFLRLIGSSVVRLHACVCDVCVAAFPPPLIPFF